ncbi:MAG: aminodeoxychorismate/anthranilate synthase component II [Candidatus Omnitrophica bacterium]|nr:aminodeoxychorismate/anthranilate synthase component II [Candidatus Omnitrophota bacterium]
MKKVLLIDNYDSFVYNLYQYISELGAEVTVKRNDQITIPGIRRFRPSKIVISPGPGRPERAGISVSLIKEFYDKIPLLGVCLGHQAIGFAMGAKIVRASRIMHGKTSLIYHNKKHVFKGLKSPFVATRYHSLIIDRKKLPSILEVCAETKEKEIMAIKVKNSKCFGIQFHPESILTRDGKSLLKNFLKL